METLALVAVLLLAVLTGVAIPVLVQLWLTIRSAGRFLDSSSARTDRLLTELTELTARISHVVEALEGNIPRMQRALDATDGLIGAVDRVRGSLRVAAAVGPAAFAAIKSLMSSFVASRQAATGPVAMDEEIPEPVKRSQHAATPWFDPRNTER